MMLVFGCQNKKTTQPVTEVKKDSFFLIEQDSLLNTEPFSKEDSVRIIFEKTDTDVYNRIEFAVLRKYFKQLNEVFALGPDAAFAKGVLITYADTLGEKQKISFSSEVGQDAYYKMYAYFLKKEEGNENFGKRREALIKIYRLINDIFGYLSYGGTYFGHQYRRILGYAEYSVYKYYKGKKFYEKAYPIEQQKASYLKALKQYIDDEVSVDVEIGKEKQKADRRKELYQLVEELDKFITDYFYLKSAQEFQYSHY